VGASYVQFNNVIYNAGKGGQRQAFGKDKYGDKRFIRKALKRRVPYYARTDNSDIVRKRWVESRAQIARALK
jgi:hypothetical protein